MRLARIALAFAALSAPALAAPATYDCAFSVSPTEGAVWPETLVARIDFEAQVIELEAGGETFRFANDPAAGYEFDITRDDDGTLRAAGYGPAEADLLMHAVILRPEGRLDWVAQEGAVNTTSYWTCQPA